VIIFYYQPTFRPPIQVGFFRATGNRPPVLGNGQSDTKMGNSSGQWVITHLFKWASSGQTNLLDLLVTIVVTLQEVRLDVYFILISESSPYVLNYRSIYG